MKILLRNFYERRTKKVAKDLLGKFIVRKIGKKKIVTQIIETEAYIGPGDLASHSRFGKTPRTAVMFGPAGHTYVFFIYGMYHCLNIVTEKEGFGAAVLIRATDRAKGPGLVCNDLKINRRLNGVDVTRNGSIYIASRQESKKTKALALPRVGVNYAGNWKDKKLRFVLRS